MKIALINIEKVFGAPPIGLSYLASYVKKYSNFKDIKIIDRENPIKAIKKYKPDIIGIGAVSEQFYDAKELAKELRKITKAPLILGGVHITIKPLDLLKTNFDIGVMGEGEKIFLNLLNEYDKNKKFDLQNLKKIKGICFKDNERLIKTPREELIEPLDSIPPIARELLKMKSFYLVPGRIGTKIGKKGTIMTSRGCPYHCVYCGSNTLFNKVRWHSAEYVVSEIEMLYKKYKVKHISIYDDLAIANKDRFRKIVELLEQKKLNKKIDFEIYARANIIDREICDLLKRLNAQTVCFGFESGSDKVLKYLKKNTVTVAQGLTAIKLCKEYNLNVVGYIMIGNPDETEEDLQKSFDFMLNPGIDLVQIYQTTPLPGTDLWEYAIKHKKIKESYYDEKHKTILKYNPDVLLTNKIDKDKFGIWYDKFIKTAIQKNISKKNLKLTLPDFIDCISIKFALKVFKNYKEALKQSKAII
ncbi:MAG: radical SAM protein [Candidatus Nanoarchaeia archaeon]